tara:strand:+ start:10783 stop:12675 length:1893 start_codon:yes stop_codon:yes gene_type:complete
MTFLALTLLAPLLSGLAILVLRRIPEALALTGAALGLIGAIGLLSTASGSPVQAVLPGLPNLPLLLIATPLTAVLSLIVATVACFVLTYAAGYMTKDPEKSRFFGTMLLFVAAMQALVLAGDWIMLLAAWEIIGFSSYLLIGFWHGRAGVASAATRAFLYTRTADLGLYLGAFLLIGTAGTSEISVTLTTTGTPALAAGLLLLVAAMGKSAQVPLQNWLQRAMAGPTPVSALLHSATLVAAGAILLTRVTPMLPDGALFVVGIVGGVTTVVTGLIALGERDLKRLLAASTSSQYGLMLVAIGAGAPVAALLHLVAHAAIKSALFLGAGVFQHDRDSTDLKALAGAARARPGIFAGFALAALALAGIPPLAAFFSKDAILAAAMESPKAPWLLPFALVGSVLTGAYMGRALKVLWTGEAGPARSSVPLMGLGMGALVVLSAVLGFGFGALEDILGAEIGKPSWIVPVMGLAVGLSGLVLGWVFEPSRLLGPLLRPAQNGFAVAGGMDRVVLRPTMAVAEQVGSFDQRLLAAQVALIGNFALRAARLADLIDTLLFEVSNWIGRQTLHLGQAAKFTDTNGIDAAIFDLVRRTIAAGARARRLQSGFIHRELALTAIGIALIVGTLLTTLIFS